MRICQFYNETTVAMRTEVHTVFVPAIGKILCYGYPIHGQSLHKETSVEDLKKNINPSSRISMLHEAKSLMIWYQLIRSQARSVFIS